MKNGEKIITIKGLVAIGFIFLAALIAWIILGGTSQNRTDKMTEGLRKEVERLYGGRLTIKSPVAYSKELKYRKEIVDDKVIKKEYWKKEDSTLTSSEVLIRVLLDQRKKGNLWFPTFKMEFTGDYQFQMRNFDPDKRYYVLATLESTDSIYDDIKFIINGEPAENVLPMINKREVEVTPDREGIVNLQIAYRSTGMGQLYYFISPDTEKLMQVNDFLLKIITDFDNYDFPHGTMSPVEKNKLDDGNALVWKFGNTITGKDIGLEIPNKLNPGKIVSRTSFFAPISLLFFFMTILLISVVTKINIHPMNYFFLAASFFSFHLMYSYFSDHLNIHLTFAIASVISLLLTITYLRLFTPNWFAFIYAPISQFIYLIVFSFSFFFKGITGMIVTVFSVITLFVFMQMTGRINWNEVFGEHNPDSRSGV